MFRFQLSSADGNELGDFTTWVPNWSIGDFFTTGDGQRFRILSIVSEADEDSPVMALWEVDRRNATGLLPVPRRDRGRTVGGHGVFLGV